MINTKQRISRAEESYKQGCRYAIREYSRWLEDHSPKDQMAFWRACYALDGGDLSEQFPGQRDILTGGIELQTKDRKTVMAMLETLAPELRELIKRFDLPIPKGLINGI